MEELTAIKTADGREFKPWASKEDVISLNEAGNAALGIQYANSRNLLKQALDTKGVEYDDNATLEDLADLCVAQIVNTGISTEGCEMLHPVVYSNLNEDMGIERIIIPEINYHYKRCIIGVESLREVVYLQTRFLCYLQSNLNPFNFEATVCYCPNVEVLYFPLLKTIGTNTELIRSSFGMRLNGLKRVYYPELELANGSYTFFPDYGSTWELLYAPKLRVIKNHYNTGIGVETVIFGKLEVVSNGKLGCCLTNDTKMVTIGEGTSINLNFSRWTGDALTDERLNENFKTGIIDNLYNWIVNPDNLTDDGNHIITTLFTSRLNADNIQALVDKGWIIA